MQKEADMRAAAARHALEREVAQLYREYATGLLRYAATLGHGPEAVQDAVQEAFLRYFVERGGGGSIGNPRGWLFRVLRNYLVDSARSASARSEVALSSAREARDGEADPESMYGRAEFQRRMHLALAPRELQCMLLRSEGFRYSEIAALLEVRTGTVSTLLSRAHRKMRGLMQPAGKSTDVADAPPARPPGALGTHTVGGDRAGGVMPCEAEAADCYTAVSDGKPEVQPFR